MSHSQRMRELLDQAIELYHLKGVHPAADLMPFMGEDEFNSLVDDAGKNGFQNAVKVTDDQLLIDGRNRICASILLEKDVHIEVFNPSDPIQYVLSENLERRHLNSQQKAMIVVEADTLYESLANQAKERQKQYHGNQYEKPNGVSQKIDEVQNDLDPETAAVIAVEMGDQVKPNDRRTDTQLAKIGGTNRDYVSKSKQVKEYAPELAADVKSGKVDLNTAAKVAKQRKKEVKGQLQEAPKTVVIQPTSNPQPEKSTIKPNITEWTAGKDADGKVTMIPKLALEPTADQSSGSVPSDTPNEQPKIDPIETIQSNGYTLHIWHSGAAKPTFNTANESIDWAWSTWNPVTGCLHGCTYCYAERIANNERMAAVYPKKFEPMFHPYRLDAPKNSRHFTEQEIIRKAQDRRLELEQAKLWAKNVFVCSMADLFGKWVPDEWIMMVFESVTKYSDWNYLFLTKYPQRLQEIGEKLGGSFPDNCWVGTTVDEQKRVRIAQDAFANIKAPVKWLSLEPLLTNLEFTDLGMFDMVAIGGETNGPTVTFTPEWAWVENILWQARQSNTAVYFKENLLCRPKEMPINF